MLNPKYSPLLIYNVDLHQNQLFCFGKEPVQSGVEGELGDLPIKKQSQLSNTF